MKTWFRIENKSEKEASVYIYDEISKWGVNAAEFVKQLNEITAKTIKLYINSPGGNVFDGVTIYNALKRHSSKIYVTIDGLAASIASVIALAGDTVDIASNGMMMVHRAWTYGYGNANDLRGMAATLDKIDSGVIVSTYQAKTGMEESDLIKLMDAETWLTAQEAKEYGFVDTIGGDADAKACFDLSKYNNVPQAALDRFAAKHEKHQATERELEHLLRDAGGLSTSHAKAMVAFAKSLRDAGDQVDHAEARKMIEYMQCQIMRSVIIR